MSDPLAVSIEIWRKWQEQKIEPPMSWIELRKKVEENIKAGKDPYDIVPLGTLPATIVRADFQRIQEKPRLPWPKSEPEAIVEESEIKTFAEWLLAAVKRVWLTKTPEQHWEWLIEPIDKGVLVGLRGVTRPHELFSAAIIEKDIVATVKSSKKTTFYFETTQERERARELLSRHNFYFPYGPEISLKDIDDPDYILELLDSEGFDTAKVMVEKHE